MGASSVCSNESFLSSLGVPPPAFQDLTKANLDKPVRVGLVRCERSVPREAQVKYDYVHQARQDCPRSSTGPSWTWTTTRDAHFTTSPRTLIFAAANQTQAISKLVGKALAELASHKHQHR